MRNLQPVLSETLKQNPLRQQVWNVDKLYKRRDICLKREKKQHMWDKGEETYIIYIYIYIKKYKNVCKNGHKTMVHDNEKDISKMNSLPN